MKRRMAAALSALVLLGLLCVPTAAAKTVYFTAVNENILELKDETMPFWSGQYLYVDGSIFTNRSLGLYSNHNRENNSLAIWETGGQHRGLVFEMETGYVNGSDGNNYYPSAVQKGGRIFVPASVVADYFGFLYSNIRVEHGYLIWLHSPDASVSILTGQEFANAATYQLSSRYQRYLQAQESGENGSTGEDPVTPVSGKTLNLCFRLGTEEHAGEILSILAGNGARATFYLTEGEIRAQQDLVRRIAVAGHRIGIYLLSGKDAPAALRSANEALFQACGGKTRLCAAESGAEVRAEELRQAGYCLLQPKVDGSARGLYTASAQSLFESARSRRGSVSVWLGESVSAGGLQKFLNLAADAQDRLYGMTERDG